MTTLDDVRVYGVAVDDLTTLAVADIEQLVNSLDASDPVVLREALLELLPQVVQPYLTATGDVAALWYEELRNQTERARLLGVQRAEGVAAGAAGATYQAQVYGTELSLPQLHAMTRRAMAPLFGQSESTVLNLISGSVQRLIANAGRDTVRGNIVTDRIRVGYARIPKPGCCAFCSMLASRGAVYRSADSAGAVTGRGMEAGTTAGKRGGQALGVTARGSQSLGDRFHDNCRCAVAPVFVGDSFASETAAEHLDVYQQHLVTDSSNAIDTNATLALIRAETGRR